MNNLFLALLAKPLWHNISESKCLFCHRRDYENGNLQHKIQYIVNKKVQKLHCVEKDLLLLKKKKRDLLTLSSQFQIFSSGALFDAKIIRLGNMAKQKTNPSKNNPHHQSFQNLKGIRTEKLPPNINQHYYLSLQNQTVWYPELFK